MTNDDEAVVQMQEEHELDRLLADFYRAELPQPWPHCQSPSPASDAPRRKWAFARHYLALAASVLVLLFGIAAASGLLSRQPSAPIVDERFPGEAKRLEQLRIPSDLKSGKDLDRRTSPRRQ